LLDDASFLNILEDFFEPDMFLQQEPNMVGALGEVQPVSGTNESWEWVINQLRSCPQDFAANAGNVFIQQAVYRDALPQAMRQAFGLCAASTCVNGRNRSMFLRSLNDTISELLGATADDGEDLADGLARLQAILLCEIMRLSHGDLKERALTDQQQTLMETRGLQLLLKMNSEQSLMSQARSWEMWLLHESVRRTVTVMFLLHGVHSTFNHGICLQISTLTNLTVSLNSKFWSSLSAYAQGFEKDTTLSYSAYTDQWMSSPIRYLDTFDKLILVACKGLDQVTKNSHSIVASG
jgi:hypothetical protein